MGMTPPALSGGSVCILFDLSVGLAGVVTLALHRSPARPQALQGT